MTPRRKTLSGILLVCALVCATGLAGAQSSGGSFSLRAHSIDGGGQRSSGGAFAVTGSIGQPDAGVHAGGTVRLTGGLWGTARGDDVLFRDGFEP